MEENQTTSEVKEPEIKTTTNGQATAQKPVGEKAPIWLKIICFLVPLVGLIMFCVKTKEKPTYANGCGIAALIGFFVMPIVILILVFGLIFIIGLITTIAAGASNSSTTSSSYSSSYSSGVSASTFNSDYTKYSGTCTASEVKTLMTKVADNNSSTNGRYILVKLDGTYKTPSSVKTGVYSSKKYKVSFDYDYSGYVDEVIITTKD